MHSNIIQKDKLKLYFNISLSIFFFILIFQPFEINFDNNNRLIFIGGLSLITFIILALLNLILPRILPGTFDFEEWKYNPDLLIYTLIVIINSVAYVFYIRFVGHVYLSIYIVFRISLLSLIPLVILKISKEYKFLLEQVNSLQEENKRLSVYLTENNDNGATEEIFYSDNRSEKIDVKLKNILFINSADNYVKFTYIEDEKIIHKLIRNTLKNIEEQLSRYPSFFRCHRTFIVNKSHVKNLTRNFKGYNLKINNFEEEIPVSRQYIMKVREVLDDR